MKKLLLLTLIAFALVETPAFGQGIFLPIGIPRPATRTGHTELIGAIQLALREGTTTADVIRIDPSPFKITNASATDVRVTPAGNLVNGTPTIDSDLNILRIPINAGGSSGSLRIEGLRLSLSGTTDASVSVGVSFEQLNVMLEPDRVTVIDSIDSGLSTQVMTDGFVVSNGQVADSTATISLGESFSSAFNKLARLRTNDRNSDPDYGIGFSEWTPDDVPDFRYR